jgi:hypothetical protein
MIVATHGILANSAPTSTLNNSLYAVYNAENNTNDSLGSYNGTANGGLTYTTGKINNAFQFNGSNAYVRIPKTTNNFDFIGNFSISCWFNQTNVGALFNNYYSISNSNRYGYYLYLQGGRVRFATYKGNTGGTSASNVGQAGMVINTNTWYHVVVTKVVGNAFKIYINNVLQSLTVIDGDLSLHPVYSPLTTINLGAEQGQAYFLNGKIDALNVWTKELTTTEITELYNSGNGKQYPY